MGRIRSAGINDHQRKTIFSKSIPESVPYRQLLVVKKYLEINGPEEDPKAPLLREHGSPGGGPDKKKRTDKAEPVTYSIIYPDRFGKHTILKAKP